MRTPHRTKLKARSSRVADYLTLALDNFCEKSQTEIAAEVGYDRSNIISMFKKGNVPVPIRVAGPLAEAIGIDPAHFVRLVLEEYMPETLQAIEKNLGALTSQSELKLIELVRQATNGADLSMDNPQDQEVFADCIRQIVARQDQRS